MESFTFDHLPLPCLHLGYRTLAGGRLYWCISYLHHEFALCGYVRKPYQMLRTVKKMIEDNLVPFVDLERDLVLKPIDCQGKVNRSVCSTSVVITAVAVYYSTNQTEKKVKDVCKAWIVAMCDLVVAMVKALKYNLAMQPPDHDDTPITLMPSGVVAGWNSFMRKLNKAANDLWTSMHPEAPGDGVALCDVLLFCTSCRRSSGVTKKSREHVLSMWLSLLEKIASNVDSYVLHVYGTMHNLTACPRLLRTKSKRARGSIDAETAWSVLERSQELALTPEDVVAVKADQLQLQAVHKIAGWRLHS